MSLKYCRRCKQIMAEALPFCPHCGASQNEQAYAADGRLDRMTWLTVGVGATLGLAGGWAMGGGAEELTAGLSIGMLAGLVWNAVRHRR
jgi:hypothetical protein